MPQTKRKRKRSNIVVSSARPVQDVFNTTDGEATGAFVGKLAAAMVGLQHLIASGEETTVEHTFEDASGYSRRLVGVLHVEPARP